MAVDSSKIKAIPIQKTLLLVNNFITRIVGSVDNFSDSCDLRLRSISSKITEIEILTTLLETKLNSIPDLADTDDDVKKEKTSNNSNTNNSSSTENSNPPPPINPPPPPSEGKDHVLQIENSSSSSSSVEVTDLVIHDSSYVFVKDHPDYAPFVKLLKVGVPLPLVKAKVLSAGLDPDLIDNPDAQIPV